ncbi:MAG TPA: hypothetical protein VJ782_05100 [Aeromicrobium sp.]|nr:hypothetical protein [Aeromicrobium sp.]
MPKTKVTLNSAGVEAILKSLTMQRAVKLKAEQVATKVRSQGITVGATEGGGEIPLPVEVESEVTDRAKSRVSIAHPAGQSVQAKYGALTKAAGQSGLDVKGAK